MDANDQIFAQKAVAMQTTTMWIYFKGSPNADITLEYDFNYEAIPKTYLDAFNMDTPPSSNPNDAAKLISSVLNAAPVSRLASKTGSWIWNHKANILQSLGAITPKDVALGVLSSLGGYTGGLLKNLLANPMLKGN